MCVIITVERLLNELQRKKDTLCTLSEIVTHARSLSPPTMIFLIASSWLLGGIFLVTLIVECSSEIPHFKRHMTAAVFEFKNCKSILITIQDLTAS
jgi:hypothetical protein